MSTRCLLRGQVRKPTDVKDRRQWICKVYEDAMDTDSEFQSLLEMLFKNWNRY